jgi:hypothetical protein
MRVVVIHLDIWREAKIKDSYEARVNAFKENRYIEDPSKMKVVGYFYPNRFNKLKNALTWQVKNFVL